MIGVDFDLKTKSKEWNRKHFPRTKGAFGAIGIVTSQLTVVFIFFLSLIVQPNQIITLNASTRIKTCDLELTHLLLDQSASMTNLSNAGTPTTGPNQPQRANAIDSESGRAVDNQYSFV